MSSRQPEASALVPLLLGQNRCNVTYLVDGSEDMMAALGSVKTLLIQTLLTKASLRDSLFNMAAFSGELTLWSQHMLPCAPDTVYMALSWIHSLRCSSPGATRDLLGALSVAFTDPDCHAIHLLCAGGVPPERPDAVLRALPSLATGRWLDVFYLQDSGGQMSSETEDYLRSLSRATRGSCFLIPVGLNGALGKVMPLCVAENRASELMISPVTCSCPSTSPQTSNSPSPRLRCSMGNHLYRVTSCTHLSDPQFFPGCRVLARREVDGLFYLGTVIQQVQGSRGVWVVEFDRPGGATFGSTLGSTLGSTRPQRQLVCSLDMLNHTKHHTPSLVPGNAVLSPWEPELMRYGPGRVMAVLERGGGFVASLRVLMWNGCVSLVPGSLVLPISASRHDRMVRELHIRTPGHYRFCPPISSCTSQMFCSDQCRPLSCWSSTTNHRPCMFPQRCSSSFGRMDGFERTELEKQVDLGDTDGGEGDHESPSTTCTSTSSSSSSCSEKLRGKQQRPPWRYWRRTGPEPQHRQPGAAVTRMSQPVRLSFSAPQLSASANHSSLFQSLPGAKGRRVNLRDAVTPTRLQPRPPAGLRPATSVHT